MNVVAIVIVLAATFVTATISGVFGMAGGLIMKGVLVSYLSVAISMVMHGFIQIVSNFSRAALLVQHISWRIVGRYALGVVAGVAALVAIDWRPNQTAVFFLLGATALLVQLPRRWLALNVERPLQAELCGLTVQVLNTLAGVAGPLLDVFFVKTDLPRQTVVASKAATQVLAHAVKIVFWGGPLLLGVHADSATREQLPATWLFASVVPLSLAGTWLGGKLLDRMSDLSFRSWTRWIVTLTGAAYLLRGLSAVL